VEVSGPTGIGRCRIQVLADGSAASLHPFVTASIAPGTRVAAGGWAGYSGIGRLGYAHEPRSQRAARARGEDPGELLPAVHRVASLAKRWLLGTRQGSVEEAHLQSYLDEFTFRFNRRRSRGRGLVFYRVLELAAGHDPVRYRDLAAGQRPRTILPAPPLHRGHPPSLDRPSAQRPWRTAGKDGVGSPSVLPSAATASAMLPLWSFSLTSSVSDSENRLASSAPATKALTSP
jgi:hypothetical protein